MPLVKKPICLRLQLVPSEKLAIAEGLRQYLLADTEGALKKAEAFKALDEGGRFLMILNALPPIIEAVGVAAEKALTPTAKAIGEGLGNVKEMRIIDMGGSGAGSSGGKNVIYQFVNLPVETIFYLVQKLKASGHDADGRTACQEVRVRPVGDAGETSVGNDARSPGTDRSGRIER